MVEYVVVGIIWGYVAVFFQIKYNGDKNMVVTWLVNCFFWPLSMIILLYRAKIHFMNLCNKKLRKQP